MEQNLYICYTKSTEIMDLQAEINWIHQELDTVEDETLLEAIKNILKYRKKASSERISVGQYNKEIDEAVLQVKNGEFYTQEEVEKMAEKW